MTERGYMVEVQPDFLEQQSKAKPIQAVAELIWKAPDPAKGKPLSRSPLHMARVSNSG